MRTHLLASLWILGACGGSLLLSQGKDDEDDAYWDSGQSAAPGGGGDDGGGADDGDLGSETEETFSGLKPALTDTYVFVANSERNTVTRVHVETLQVLTAEVGVDPVVVRTTSDHATAVTFNAGTDDEERDFDSLHGSGLLDQPGVAAAVELEVLARDEPGLRAAQERARVAELLGAPESLCGDRGLHQG